MRGTTQAQREAARSRQAPQHKGVDRNFAGLDAAKKPMSPLGPGAGTLATMATPLSMPDYFAVGNFANSPLPQIDVTGAITGTPGAVIPGTGMRKFVDTLPGLCGVSAPNDLNQCIPVAVPDTATFPGSDFYRIGVYDFSQQMHQDLPPTQIRGYVQLDASNAPMYDPAVGTQQYFGPLIIATRDRPVRFLVKNALTQDLFIPVDLSYMGAGMVDDGTHQAVASSRREVVHLHGGNTPWISDGTPHQWITPAGADGQPDVVGFAKGWSFRNVPDMVGPGNLIASPSLTDGLATHYYTNQQSGRLLFFHDHVYGTTRLDVYAGEAAGFLIVDPAQEALLASATVPGTIGSPGNLPAADNDLTHFMPLVIQDKTFVPDNGDAGGQLAAQDPTWDVVHYGGKGSLWFPHVYMPNQNPYDLSGANPFGRWDYGPWFWPPQPVDHPEVPCQSAAYPGQWLTCPATPNPSGTMEGFMDTPLVNGTAYPSVTLKPSAYRFQILSVGNDRAFNLGLYYAVDKNGVVCKGGNAFDPASCTEMSMVPAVPHDASSTPPLCSQATSFGGGGLAVADTTGGSPINGTGLPASCWPTTWPTDGRDGGVPDPATAGPPIIQIGTDSGLLPAPAVIPSTPMGYEYNRRSITVLNIYSHGLLLGPAERAEVLVDFSGVPAGSILIVYNDAPAPAPAFDSRIDYYTGDPDQTDTGGAPSTIAGYGPNTRTVMQIKVEGTGDNTTPFDLATLQTQLPAIFAQVQNQIIVPEPEYPVGNGFSPQGNYVRIQDTSFPFFSGGPVGGINLVRGGAYISAPSVAIAGGGGSGATATATLGPKGVARVAMLSGGSGYTSAPAVAFTGGGGSGAAGNALLLPTAVASLAVMSPGSGYTSAPAVSIAPPPCSIAPPTCVQALATAVVAGGQVTGLTLTEPGAG